MNHRVSKRQHQIHELCKTEQLVQGRRTLMAILERHQYDWQAQFQTLLRPKKIRQDRLSNTNSGGHCHECSYSSLYWHVLKIPQQTYTSYVKNFLKGFKKILVKTHAKLTNQMKKSVLSCLHCILLGIFFFFFGHTLITQKFPGQGLNPGHGSDNARSLTHQTTKELPGEPSETPLASWISINSPGRTSFTP